MPDVLRTQEYARGKRFKKYARFDKPGDSYKAEVVAGGRSGEKALQISGQGEYCVVVLNQLPMKADTEYAVRGWSKITGEPEAVARFDREMKAVGRLKHPNIVFASDAGESAGIPFLVMEFVEGIDLGRLVKQRRPLQVADACEAARQAAIGLQHAHEHGMVHRDVKPRNLMP